MDTLFSVDSVLFNGQTGGNVTFAELEEPELQEPFRYKSQLFFRQLHRLAWEQLFFYKSLQSTAEKLVMCRNLKCFY